MPTHGIVPYEFGLREKGATDNFWNLEELKLKDPTLPHTDVMDSLREFFKKYSGKMKTVKNREKTFIVEDYHIDGNFAEAIIATGSFGYEADLRDINTGSTTYQKGVDEAEVLPYYFIFWTPKTINDKLHNNGEGAIMIFQQINGGSVKSIFKNSFEETIVDDAENTIFSMKPVTSQEVLDKVIGSQRVRRAEVELKKMPQDSESQVQLIEGMDTQEVANQSLVLKPNHGSSLFSMKKKAKELKKEDSSFAKVVSDDVSELKVTIEKRNGRDETFSLLEDELKMRKELTPPSSSLNNGLPTTQYLCREACKVVNDVYPSNVVKKLNRTPQI